MSKLNKFIKENQRARRRRSAQKEYQRARSESSSLIDSWGPQPTNVEQKAIEKPQTPSKPSEPDEKPPAPRYIEKGPSKLSQFFASKNPRALLLLASLSAAIFLIAAVLYGGPLWGSTWNFPVFFGLTATSLFFVFLCFKIEFDMFNWRSYLGPTIALSVVFIFFLGLFTTSVVIDGKVYANNSETAQIYQAALETRDDAITIRKYDSLLVLQPPQDRARINEFPKAQDEVTALFLKYERLHSAGTSDSQLEAAYYSLFTAAGWALEALNSKEQLAREPDTKLEQDMIVQRATYLEEWNKIGSLLLIVGETNGFDVTFAQGEGE